MLNKSNRKFIPCNVCDVDGTLMGKKNASYVKSATAWEYYDLIKDPLELKNEFYNPDYKNEILKLHQELIKEKQLAGDKETLIPNINEV